MKNFVIATVSAVALLGTAAYAEAPMMKEVQPAHQMAGEHQMGGEHCPPHQKHHKKHHRYAKKHHKHLHRGHPGGHPLAVRVEFPPVNVAAFSACPCESYQGNQEAKYVYHEGYYWYPQMRADMWAGYQPVQMHGFHWYPSILHPHAVYVEKQSPMHPALYPVAGEIGMGRGHRMHHRHHRHHGARHHGARHHAARHHAAKHHAQPMHQEEMHQPAAHPANPGM